MCCGRGSFGGEEPLRLAATTAKDLKSLKTPYVWTKSSALWSIVQIAVIQHRLSARLQSALWQRTAPISTQAGPRQSTPLAVRVRFPPTASRRPMLCRWTPNAGLGQLPTPRRPQRRDSPTRRPRIHPSSAASSPGVPNSLRALGQACRPPSRALASRHLAPGKATHI